MKFLRYIIAVLAGGLAASACSELETVQASDSPVASVLAEYTLPIEITEQNMNQKLSFEWSPADFGYNAAVTYALCGVMDDGEPGVVATVTTTKSDVPMKDFNRAMLAIGAKGNKLNNVTLYVEAYISEALNKVKSNTIAVSVTPFRINFAPALYVPGSHQGWSPATAPALPLIDDEEGLYDGFLNFPDANPVFKFTGQSDWNPDNWGGTLAKLEYGGGDITDISEAGFYRMSVNLPKLKATPFKVEAVSMIGDATPNGWGADTELTQDGYLWKTTATMATGKFKVRFNNDWAFSLGGVIDNLSTSGGDIPFDQPGTYDVVLDLSKYPWTITFTEK